MDPSADAVLALVRRVVRRLGQPRAGTGGTDRARYCYAVWLRHLVALAEVGLPTDPDVVLELGPGDTVGVGIMALLTGASEYVALDAHHYDRADEPVGMVAELAALLADRAPIPDETEFPEVRPWLGSYAFPPQLLPPDRVARPADAEATSELMGRVRYLAPWDVPDVVESGSADLVMSQAVLEHVRDLDAVYSAMATWLHPGGVGSHQVDFKSHGTATAWNGYWRYSATAWRVANGRRSGINREPLSAHLAAIRRAGLELVASRVVRREDGIARSDLARDWRWVSDDDLTASSAWLAVQKPPA